jgi:hypothetical protein
MVHAQCTVPSAKSSTTPPTSFDFETIADGEWTSTSVWKNGNVPSKQPQGKDIKISHEVYVNNGSIQLKDGSVLYVVDGKFTIKNGNMELLDGKYEKFLAVRSKIEFSGNAQQKETTVFYCKTVELFVGDKGDASGDPVFASGGSTTSADFQNDKGYRRLEDVCLIVTHDYDNTGEDELVNVCAEIGIRNPLNSSNPVGQGSGNLNNYSSATSLKIYGSQFFIPNGNVQNSKEMTTCDSKFKLTNGNFQNQSSSTWDGEDLVIWVTGNSNHDLQNSGTWNVDVEQLCINGQIQGTYSTALPSENCGTIADQFNSTCCADVVPVTWLRIAAEKVGQGAIVTWATASELDNDYFTVERSGRNGEFTEVGIVEGSGTKSSITEYAFEDVTPYQGVTYYRIKQTDYNGDYKYSPIVLLGDGVYTPSLKVYPNPVSDLAMVTWSNSIKTDVVLRITNALGQEIKAIATEPGSNTQTLDLSNYDKGLYVIQITVNGDVVNRQKVMVAR